MKKTMILIGICLLTTSSFFNGCVDIPKGLTQFSIMSFDVEPSIINQGEYANLSWIVLSASSVTIDNGIGNVALTGHRMIQPTQTTTYILTASNATVTKSVHVTLTIRSPVQYDQIAIGDCADVYYIGRYASNNTIFNSSGETPFKVFVNLDKNVLSPKPGYSAGLVEGFIEGLIGMKERETKIIGPIPPNKAYGEKFGVGAIFTTQYFAFGMNQIVEVTEYTPEHISFRWIQLENLGNFTMPQLIISNLQSSNETEMVIYPPPYYIWENATSIISISDDNVIVRTTPTKSTNLSDDVKDVREGDKQTLIFPNASIATWDENTITVECSPLIGHNYTLQTPGVSGMVNITVTVNSIIGDMINVTITNDQSPEPTYLDVYRILTFNRTFAMPRVYKDIPSMYISYFYGENIQKAGYSLEPLAGESLFFEVTVEKIYKTVI